MYTSKWPAAASREGPQRATTAAGVASAKPASVEDTVTSISREYLEKPMLTNASIVVAFSFVLQIDES